MTNVKSVAIIGSFRQYYDQVMRAEQVLGAAGLEITSPQGTYLVDQEQEFVRFQEDRGEWSDEMLQVVTLHRILRADFVYAVVPGGYVGRATCYEIGRTIQSNQPLYFSEKPEDLPITIPPSHVLTPGEIVDQLAAGSFDPQPIHSNLTGTIGMMERNLVDGIYSAY